jgi:hypothetical protein
MMEPEEISFPIVVMMIKTLDIALDIECEGVLRKKVIL